MLKGEEKQTDKEQGKTKHEASRSVNYRATQNKNNIGTTALERSKLSTRSIIQNSSYAYRIRNYTNLRLIQLSAEGCYWEQGVESSSCDILSPTRLL